MIVMDHVFVVQSAICFVGVFSSLSCHISSSSRIVWSWYNLSGVMTTCNKSYMSTEAVKRMAMSCHVHDCAIEDFDDRHVKCSECLRAHWIQQETGVVYHDSNKCGGKGCFENTF